MNIVKLDGPMPQGSWFSESSKPFTSDLEESWTLKLDIDFNEQYFMAAKNWIYLAPFFAPHGYHLYVLPRGTHAVRPPASPKASQDDTYPFARRVYTHERELDFYKIQFTNVLTLRRHDAIYGTIRFRSLTISPSMDWCLWFYQGQWGADAFSIRDPFKSISEMFDIAEAFFEGLEFLHEKRIAHGDIAENNVVVNKIGRYELKIPNTRAPDVVKYAFIDFDASVIFPEDTDVTKVRVPRGDRLPLHALGLFPGELCNPFEEDVKCLANTLQEWTRNMEAVIPEIGPFFDGILKNKDARCPSAAQCLQELRRIRSRLNTAQLDHPPLGSFWRDGKLFKH
ncbi:hypothetical protein EST38_g13116 [Candolleomyces aberdarensis]|uniref:Protein kinase domain-containing protein n=1 Tax=Candolleomyces aberdarensis TaxID=2316362 RepID=A0A4Q2D1G5_9AGAR|nr:hypothetical protein EST38_g13116 [Candolleomyces aberdarensis]